MTRWEHEDLSRGAFVKRLDSGIGILSLSALPLSLSALEATPAASNHHSLLVTAEREKKRQGEPSELMDFLIAPTESDLFEM